MDILYGDKLNRVMTASHITLSLLDSNRLVVYRVICMIFIPEFAENMNLDIFL